MSESIDMADFFADWSPSTAPVFSVEDMVVKMGISGVAKAMRVAIDPIGLPKEAAQRGMSVAGYADDGQRVMVTMPFELGDGARLASAQPHWLWTAEIPSDVQNYCRVTLHVANGQAEAVAVNVLPSSFVQPYREAQTRAGHTFPTDSQLNFWCLEVGRAIVREEQSFWAATAAWMRKAASQAILEVILDSEHAATAARTLARANGCVALDANADRLRPGWRDTGFVPSRAVLAA